MTSERLHEFYILATLLNFSRAAENLFISQSVLSRHMQALEAELSTKLFVRDTHSVSLTEEGRYLLKEAEAILRKADLIEGLCGPAPVDTAGQVLIRCHEQTLCQPVLSFLQSFKARYPAVTLNFRMIPSAPDISVIEDADVLLSPCDFTDRLPPGMSSALLLTQEAYLAYPPRHPFGDLQSLSLAQIGGETLFVPYADELFGPYARNALLASRKCPGYFRRVGVPSPADGFLRVEMGEGIMILPHHLKNRVYPGTRTLPVKDPECRFPVYLYSGRSKNPAAELFLKNIRQSF